MKRHHLLATAALILFSAPALSLAQTPTPQKTVTEKGQLSPQDMTFVEEAAISDMYEIQAGKLAQDHAKDNGVKQFGNHMVTEHTKTSDAMKTMAQQKSVTLPTKLDSAHQQKLDKLRGLQGEQFDAAYLQDQIDGHQQAVALFRTQAEKGQDPDLKRFAEQTLPALEQHLRQVRDLRPNVASTSSAPQQSTSFESMIGEEVYGEDGGQLGEVADIILDAQTGDATQVILDRGGILGIGDKQIALDFSLLEVDGDRIVARQVTEEQVNAMPEFHYGDNTVSLGQRSGSGGNAGQGNAGQGNAGQGAGNSPDSTPPRNPQ